MSHHVGGEILASIGDFSTLTDLSVINDSHMMPGYPQAIA
jgi:hypothetical protein